MADTTLISPLLDGFSLGIPINSHFGVTCYPAIKENSDKKYIVKKISVPASQVQMDALLLTGAYKDPADALDYFKSRADEIADEAEFLQKLAHLEGFLPYDGWQIEPMGKNRLGYDIYLVGTYKRSLDKYMERHPITHLEAVNLGLDLCAALSVCRRAGFLYVDLKPGNIFLSGSKEYRIGDLGFSPLDSLKYTSMPEKYYSAYTAPEVRDPMNPLNTSVDTYAVGMILYEIFNGGALPQIPENPGTEFPAPLYADEQMAQIIGKACAVNPDNRWKDPVQMGQALVAYMQSHTVNDIPVIPEEILRAREAKAEAEAAADQVPETVRFPEPISATPDTDGNMESEIQPIESPEAIAPEAADQLTEEMTAFPDIVPPSAEPDHEQDEPAMSAMEEQSIYIPEQDMPISDVPAEEPPTLPIQAPEDTWQEYEVPEEKASPDDLIDPELLGIDLEAELQEVGQILSSTQKRPVRTLPKKVPPPPTKPVVVKQKKSAGSFLVSMLVFFLLAVVCFCGYGYYRFYYLQTIDSIHVEGSQHEMTVTVRTRVDNSLLTVVSSDVYGNTQEQPLENGHAVFTDLKPDSLYNIRVEISGLHKLNGQISDIFTTASQTDIVSFTAITGPEDGSVILNLTANGFEPDEWTVNYAVEGDDPMVHKFSGHNTTIKGLTVGSEYIITLSGPDDMLLTGQHTITFTASELVLAQNLNVASIMDGKMEVHWNQPSQGTVDAWNVRCYGDGYDETISVTETKATFTGIDAGTAYTVEVTAAGMTAPVRTNVSANPITVTTWHFDDTNQNSLSVTWDYNGNYTGDSWLLLYAIDGQETPSVIKCDSNFAVIEPLIPGATYALSVQTSDEVSIFDNTYTYTVPDVNPFDAFGVTIHRLKALTLPTPDDQDWNVMRVSKSDYTDTFTPGQKISVVLNANVTFYLDHTDVPILMVIRNEEGNVVSNLFTQETQDWHDLWYPNDYHYCELNGPAAPDTPGNYTLDIYVNMMSVASMPIIVSGS